MAKDIAFSANLPADKVIVINNIIDLNEVEQKIKDYFDQQ